MRSLKFAGPALLTLRAAPISAQEPPKKFKVDLSDEQVDYSKLRGGIVVEQRFVVRETKTVLPHKNKFGKPYKEKY